MRVYHGQRTGRVDPESKHAFRGHVRSRERIFARSADGAPACLISNFTWYETTEVPGPYVGCRLLQDAVVLGVTEGLDWV
jgi:hypothetical protein